MELEALLNLFDTHWFYLKFLEKIPEFSPIVFTTPLNQEIQSDSILSKQFKTPLARSRSEEIPQNSPNSAIISPHLQTICSGKEMSSEVAKMPQFRKPHRKRLRRLSKSLSELEFEELTGFMDLGFVFSEEDKEDLSLVEIVPGIQRLGREKSVDKEIDGPRAHSRPYLSEAWEVMESPVVNWRVPVVGNEIVMKDSLKLWAHTVASAVR